jgi:hypothetical protein
MLPFPTRQTTRLWIGGTLALLVGVLAAPSWSRASCGDYVHIGGPDTRRAAGHGEAPKTPADHPGPCHGPNCGRNPAAPAAPAFPAPAHPREWGCVPHPAASRSLSPGYPFPGEGSSRPVKRPSPVWHPPRA